MNNIVAPSHYDLWLSFEHRRVCFSFILAFFAALHRNPIIIGHPETRVYEREAFIAHFVRL